MLSLFLFFVSILPIHPGKIVITSDFGEARPLRYHMGLDFSTHGRCGYPVYSVTDGRIVRIKRSYYGYGNAVYIMSEDSNLYVYAHLDRFINPLEDTVFKVQMRRRKYRQDIYFEKQPIEVKKGQVIGYSGESGVGYPHLHFERRVGWLMPVFPLSDTIPFEPYLDGVFIETPQGNYRVSDIRFHEIRFPHFKRFKMFLSLRHAQEVSVYEGDTLCFLFRLDTLNYLTQKESGLLFKPRSVGFRGYIRTNYDSIYPKTVKKFVNEYRNVDTLSVRLVSFYGDTVKYKIIFGGVESMSPVFDTTYDGIQYSFSDYGIYVNKEAKEKGYSFLKFNGDTFIKIGDSTVILELNTTYFPYLKGVFYRKSGNMLFVYPELPQLTGYIYARTDVPNKEVYRISDRRKKFVHRTLKLGAFLAIHDSVAPYVKFVGANDSIAFYVDDWLSGVDADSFLLLVNGKWYPIYYDYERKVAVLRHPLLKNRTYDIYFRAMDRAYNKKEWSGKVYLK